MQCLRTRSPTEVSWQDRRTRSLDVSWQYSCTSSLEEISTEDLCKGSQRKIFVQAFQNILNTFLNLNKYL